MRTILRKEIKRERCNAAALGAYNASVGGSENIMPAPFSVDPINLTQKQFDYFKNDLYEDQGSSTQRYNGKNDGNLNNKIKILEWLGSSEVQRFISNEALAGNKSAKEKLEYGYDLYSELKRVRKLPKQKKSNYPLELQEYFR